MYDDDEHRYFVITAETGAPLLLVRVNRTGGHARYAGDGVWIPNGYRATYLGPRGPVDGEPLAPADVPAMMAAMDARYGTEGMGGVVP